MKPLFGITAFRYLIITYELNGIISTFCDNTQFWCKKSGYGLKSNDPGFSTLNHTEYKACVSYCHEKITCKTFEYKSNQKICKFSSRLAQNVEEPVGTQYEVFWKKGTSLSCSQEMAQGKVLTFKYQQLTVNQLNFAARKVRRFGPF